MRKLPPLIEWAPIGAKILKVNRSRKLPARVESSQRFVCGSRVMLRVKVRVEVFILERSVLHFCKHDVMTPYRYDSYSGAVAKWLQKRSLGSQESAPW